MSDDDDGYYVDEFTGRKHAEHKLFVDPILMDRLSKIAPKVRELYTLRHWKEYDYRKVKVRLKLTIR